MNFKHLAFAAIVGTFASDASCVLGVGVAVGNHVVEILPLVPMVGFVMVVFVEIFHERRRVGFADKGISMENVETAFLVKAFDVDIGHNVVALRLSDGQPGLNRSRDTGIMDTGASLSKWTVERIEQIG